MLTTLGILTGMETAAISIESEAILEIGKLELSTSIARCEAEQNPEVENQEKSQSRVWR